MSEEERSARGDGGSRAFGLALQTLKQEGCSLLVVGTAPDSAYKDVCRQMLGDSNLSPRRRLFVATDREIPTACELLSTGVQQPTPTTAKVLSFTGTVRSATAHSPPPQARIPIEVVAGSKLADLGIAISEAIAEFEVLDGGLAPAELRVCIDSLTPLVDHGYDSETLFRFLDLLNARIRGVRGMGYVCLRTERDSEIVHLLEPLFDAVVELREKEGEPQQRWHLLDAAISSGWITRND